MEQTVGKKEWNRKEGQKQIGERTREILKSALTMIIMLRAIIVSVSVK